ncbi:hypothetical protein TruAng_001812 [Truncatella angustata]|nr:hypothetical protein TruAng_001812 [Truncatella angustata]
MAFPDLSPLSYGSAGGRLVKEIGGSLGQQPLDQLELSGMMSCITATKHLQRNGRTVVQRRLAAMVKEVQPWKSISEQGSDCSSSIRLSDSVHDDTSTTTPSTISPLSLPFIQQLPSLSEFPSLPHYRMMLSVDKKIKAATLQTAFGPVINMGHKNSHSSSDGSMSASFGREPVKQPPSIKKEPPNTDNRPVGNRGNGSGASNGHGQRRDPREDDEEHPRAPPTSPIEPTPEPESFNNRLFMIRASLTAGFGAFALQSLHRGQIILVEKALFHADNMSLYDEIEKLTSSLKQAFDRMHAHNASSYPDGGLDRAAIFGTNSKRGVFLVASRFNHACKPMNNIAYIYDRRQNSIVFSTAREIEKGEELFINYGKHPENLYQEYGFVCNCGGCRVLTDAEIAELENPVGR